MNPDEILDKLTQEERLELLERLIKGSTSAREESLTLEQRVERLEKTVGAGTKPVVKMIRMGVCDCCD